MQNFLATSINFLWWLLQYSWELLVSISCSLFQSGLFSCSIMSLFQTHISFYVLVFLPTYTYIYIGKNIYIYVQSELHMIRSHHVDVGNKPPRVCSLQEQVFLATEQSLPLPLLYFLTQQKNDFFFFNQHAQCFNFDPLVSLFSVWHIYFHL